MIISQIEFALGMACFTTFFFFFLFFPINSRCNRNTLYCLWLRILVSDRG